jgi:hypothetical protein
MKNVSGGADFSLPDFKLMRLTFSVGARIQTDAT